MRLLFCLDKYGAPSGGADAFARGAAAALADAGHTVQILRAGPSSPPPDQRCVDVETHALPYPRVVRDGDWRTLDWNRRWRPVVDRAIRIFRPDAVLTQNMLAPSSVAAAQAAGVRTVLFFHGYRCLSPDFFQGRDARTAPATTFANAPWRARLKWPWVRRCLDAYAAAFRSAQCVIANSTYAAGVIERFFERPAEVLYPVQDLQEPSHSTPAPPGGSVLFVKPQPVKGVHLLLQVSRHLPEHRFVVVGPARRRVRTRLARAPNIEHRPWTEDMQALYRQAALLFGPSQIPEPFGRVFVEAGLQGVPSLASAAGGIPEAVGSGGALLPFDATPEEWGQALCQCLAPATWPGLAGAARAHAASLVQEHGPDRLVRLVTDAQ